jgi:DNA-binding transcriptional LysR family regulator
MELRHIQSFIAVAEELHFGKAAQRLSMSQPPLSQQIQHLEKLLNVQLFERTRREVKLTNAGKALLPNAYKLLEASISFTDTAIRVKDGRVGKLNIGCISTAFYEILPNLVKSFQLPNPEINLTIREDDTSAIYSKLLEGDYDLGIILQRKMPGEPEIDYYPLVKEKFVVALPTQHHLASKTEVSLRDLSCERFVICERQSSPQLFDLIISSCLAGGFSPKIMYNTNSFQNQLGFVACGFAVAILPQFVSRLNFPGVVYHILNNDDLNIELTLAWNTKFSTETTVKMVNVTKGLYCDSNS